MISFVEAISLKFNEIKPISESEFVHSQWRVILSPENLKGRKVDKDSVKSVTESITTGQSLNAVTNHVTISWVGTMFQNL